MQISKEQVLRWLVLQHDEARLRAAQRDLPDQIDTRHDQPLLHRLGIDIKQLALDARGAGGERNP